MLDRKWLKETRLKLGLTMKQVGDEMFVTKQCICDIESGKSHKKSTMAVYERLLIEHSKEDYSI